MGCVYLIKNETNGMCYVGQTKHNAEFRLNKHINSVRQKTNFLAVAIKEFGHENFSVQTLIDGIDSQQERVLLEGKFINDLNTLHPNGYNSETSGERNQVCECVCNRRGEKLKGREVTWSDKVSSAVKKLWKNKEYRDKQIKQRHQKRGKYRDGIQKPLRLELPVDEVKRLYSLGVSIYAIAKKFGVSHCTIKRRLKQ